MKINKKLYPKTSRIGDQYVEITEKLDGSNLGIFKLDGDIYVAQRNYIYKVDSDMFRAGDGIYKGMLGWMNEHHDFLKENLHENSALWGEWIGQGHIGYGENLDKRFYMFAKANVYEGFEASAIIYKHELFHWCFKEQVLPDFIGVVPVVTLMDSIPSISVLDKLYDEYCSTKQHTVEGFIIRMGNSIEKYVRHKSGVATPHKKPR